MSTTDTDTLTERIRRARSVPAEWARLREGESTMEQIERHQRRMDEQTAALVAEEVRKAKAEALREAARVMGEWAGESLVVIGDELDESTWVEMTVGEWLEHRATEYETGGKR